MSSITSWSTHSPLLRRVNLAFMSGKFANANPYNVTLELHEREKQIETLHAEVLGNASERSAALEKEKTQFSVQIQRLQTQLDAACSAGDDFKQRLAEKDSLLESVSEQLADATKRLTASEQGRSEAQVAAEQVAKQLSSNIDERNDLKARLAQSMQEQSVILAVKDELVARLTAEGATHQAALDELNRFELEEQTALGQRRHQSTTIDRTIHASATPTRRPCIAEVRNRHCDPRPRCDSRAPCVYRASQ